MKTPQSKSTKLDEGLKGLYRSWEGLARIEPSTSRQDLIDLLVAYVESKVLEGRRDELGKLGGLNLYNQPTGYKANKKLHAHIEKRLEYFERALINKSCPICRKEDLDPEWLKAHLKTHAELEATPTNKEQD